MKQPATSAVLSILAIIGLMAATAALIIRFWLDESRHNSEERMGETRGMIHLTIGYA